jgi:hypothetical protein
MSFETSCWALKSNLVFQHHKFRTLPNGLINYFPPLEPDTQPKLYQINERFFNGW